MAKNKKRAQTTTWIILGVIIAAAILLLIFLVIKQDFFTQKQSGAVLNMEDFLRACTSSAVLEAVDIILPQGGFIEPKNYVVYNGSRVEYICETINPYEKCIQQHPLLIQEIEKEIKEYILPKIDNCFASFKTEQEKKAISVKYNSPTKLNVNLVRDKAVLNIEKKITIEKEGDVRDYDSLKTEIKSPIYNLAFVALEIAAQEAKYCYFENVGYSLYYPRYRINLFNLYSDGTKLYTINDKKSNKFMYVATRGCVALRGI